MPNDPKTSLMQLRSDAISASPRASVVRQRNACFWLAASDAIGLTLSWLISFAVLWAINDTTWRQGILAWWSQLGTSRILVFIGLLAIVLLLFGFRGHYTRRRPAADEVLDIGKVFLVIAILDAVFDYLSRWQFSRSWFLSAWMMAIVFVPFVRAGTKHLLARAGRWQRPTAILGIGANAREAARALRSEPLMGLEVVAFLLPPAAQAGTQTIEVGGRELPVVPLGDDPAAVLDELGSPQVVAALEADELLASQRLLQILSVRDSNLSIIPPLRGLPLYGMEVTHFFSHEVLMLTARNNLARPGPQFVKRVFDIVSAFLLLVALSPLFAYLILKIRQSGAAAIFGHVRIGRQGRPFRCLKFRTMVPDADRVLADLLERDPESRAEWERDFKLKSDPRITPIGAFLRRTSLDELPQLWNVLRGEMSLVGPRPIITEELDRYGDQVGYYLEARPGITGLWQISGRNDTGYEDRVALDSWYVRNWSLWYDLVILVKTVRVVLRREGAY